MAEISNNPSTVSTNNKFQQDQCGCIPWKYPQFGGPENICDFVGNQCFKNVFDRGDNIVNCSCFPDCSKITYDVYITKEPINAETECALTPPDINYLLRYANGYLVRNLKKKF